LYINGRENRRDNRREILTKAVMEEITTEGRGILTEGMTEDITEDK